uniref:Ribosomal protein L2 n=1 Tax=Melosira undulata TaxID=2133757 RepID=A0A3G1PWF1_9STRA|nr:ribosomal protein L2 [Melosira undulata]AVR57561.1 ribosomal protein L2 [Melosira undulata]
MILKFVKPTNSSQRNLILISNKSLFKYPLIKYNLIGLKNSTGRNNQGKITVFSKGGGKKQKYRKIDFTNHLKNKSIITSIEYDPNRSANIMSIFDCKFKKYYYKIAPIGQKIGDIIYNSNITNLFLGHTLNLNNIPIGTFIYNLAIKNTEKAKFARAAGSFGFLVEKNFKNCLIKLNSGKTKAALLNGYASLGIISNEFFCLKILAKAGRSRWLNKKPKVRGVAMNPVDHPHGGGEGKTSGGRPSVTPWGKPTKF